MDPNKGYPSWKNPPESPAARYQYHVQNDRPDIPPENQDIGLGHEVTNQAGGYTVLGSNSTLSELSQVKPLLDLINPGPDMYQNSLLSIAKVLQAQAAGQSEPQVLYNNNPVLSVLHHNRQAAVDEETQPVDFLSVFDPGYIFRSPPEG